MYRCAAILLSGLLSLVVSAATTASAGPSPERLRLTETSIKDGLSARELPLLEIVAPEGDPDGKANQLLQLGRLLELLNKSSDSLVHVRNPGRLSRTGRSTVLFAADKSWYLEVIGDGTRFRYHGNVDGLKQQAGGPLDLATLERLGRDFVVNRLRPLVSLAEGERLVFLGSRYLREGSATEKEPFTSTVSANIAIFGREVGGVFIAGSGSRVTVWFTNDQKPVGFFADWPKYRQSKRTVTTLDIRAIWDRMANYADRPIDIIRQNLKHFECGYVDLGVGKRRLSIIQPGCVVSHAGGLGEFHYGAIEAIPIGVTVVPDLQWPVTAAIAAGDRWDLCRVSKTLCNEPPQSSDRGKSLGSPEKQ